MASFPRDYEAIIAGALETEHAVHELQRIFRNTTIDIKHRLSETQFEVLSLSDWEIDDRLITNTLVFRDGMQLDVSRILEVYDDYEERARVLTSLVESFNQFVEVDEDDYAENSHKAQLSILIRAGMRTAFFQNQRDINATVDTLETNRRHTDLHCFLKEIFDICTKPNAAEIELMKKVLVTNREDGEAIAAWFSVSRSRLGTLLLLKDIAWAKLRRTFPVSFLRTEHGNNTDKENLTQAYRMRH